MRKITAFVILSLALAVFPVHADQTIFVFDLSPGMGEVCPGGGNTPLSLATELAQRRLAYAEHKSVTIIGFSRQVEILGEDAGPETAKLLSRLQLSTEDGSLASALAAAHELTRRSAEKSRVVAYSTGGNDSVRPLVDALGALGADGVPVELNFFHSQARAGEEKSDGSTPLRIVRYGCEKGETGTLAPILQQVRQIVSLYTGMPTAEIGLDSRLSEFAADRLQGYEILSALAAEFHVSLPGKDDPSIGELVGFIAEKAGKYAQAHEVTAEMNIDAAPAYGAAAAVKEAFFQQKIFYATNRKRTGKAEAGQFYGGERSSQGKMDYGTCIVTIPAQHKEGAVETPFLGLTFLEDEKEHVRLLRVTPVGRDDFFRSLKGSLNSGAVKEGWENDAVVFIHGFNVPFDEAAKRTAQMAFDFGFKGAPILFSWPSDGKFYAYMADREDIQWSVQHIEQFLNELAETLLPRRIHLVAHSMGNQGLIGALNMLALRRGAENRPLFENVILAAPDFDAQLFQEQIAPRVQKIAKRWTVYTSDNDAALNISTTINSARRLGLPVTPVNGIDVVDASGIEVTPWSVPEFHSYYATKQTVIQDIVNTIKGVAPSMRALLPRVEAGIPYWRLGATTVGK